jgi:class 3 adenylate cyclase
MRLQHAETHEPRYDAATLKKVTSLAQRLQAEQRETLTAREIESAGAEVGLDPTFIRSALAHLEDQELQRHAPVEGVEKGEKILIGTSAALMAMLGFALALSAPRGSSNPNTLIFFWMLVPTLCPALVGYFSGRSKLGLTTAFAILAANVIAGAMLIGIEGGGPAGMLAMAFLYLLFGGPLATSFGWLGGWFRQRRSGRGKRSTHAAQVVEPSRRELLEAVVHLQRQLEGPKVHRAFLSVDVAGPAELKRGEGELAIEYSFSEFRHWVEEIATAHGGEVLPSVTDGTLCVFADEATAGRAARQLHETLQRFNESANRLSRPFRVRCGIASGEVAGASLTSATRPQTWLIDHAIALQRSAAPGDIRVSQAAAGTALPVLGSLAQAGEMVEGEPAFSWKEATAPAVAY